MKLLKIENSAGFALVDDADYEQLSKYKWYLDRRKRRSYVRRIERNPNPQGPRQRSIYLHRQIMQPPADMEIDHINSDGMDNRRENLRMCTRRENNQNARKRIDSKQNYKGVWKTENGRFAARIWDRGAKIHIGVYDTDTQAAQAYDTKAKELFGEFAKLNFESK